MAARNGYVAEAGTRPENLIFIGALARELQECTIGFLGGGEIFRAELKPAVPDKPFGVFWIERHSLGIGLARCLRIAQPCDGTEVAIGNRRFLPGLFSLRGRLLGMGRLILGDGVQKLRRLGDFVSLQETERFLQARIALFRTLRDRTDRRADRLLRARPCRNGTFIQQHFGQSGDLRVLLA